MRRERGHMEKSKKVLFFLAFIALSLKFCFLFPETGISAGEMYHVYAKESCIQYSYDLSGRLVSAQYPDGTQITYVYDEAGNLKSTVVEAGRIDETTAENGSTEDTTGEEKTEEETDGKGNPEKGENSQEKNSLRGLGYIKIKRMYLQGSRQDAGQYESFKKKRPVIKSLKTEQGKLKIQIRKMNLQEPYSESGYQIKYAVRADFKQAKTVTARRKKKAAITDKKWKVKKKKTYYVKARAYIRTETGEYIYSRYSKVKKIQAGR